MCEVQHSNEEKNYIQNEPYFEKEMPQSLKLDERVPNQSPGKDIYIFCGNSQPSKNTRQKDKSFNNDFNSYLKLGENAVKSK